MHTYLPKDELKVEISVSDLVVIHVDTLAVQLCVVLGRMILHHFALSFR